MKRPHAIPDIRQLLQKAVQKDPQKLIELYQLGPTDYKGRYLHWDKLRYMLPPPGLTAEEYWLGTKLARLPLQKSLPLFDADGHPFKVATPDNALKMLHQIDRNASGRIKMAEPVANIKNRDMYLLKSLIEEAINSSQLEGASTTRQAAQEMLRMKRKPKDRSEQMILNNFQAMEFVREHKDDPLTPALVFELHQTVTENTLDKHSAAGTFRTDDDQIVIVDTANEKILHTPPPANELPERLARLCDFANNTEPDTFIHPVVKAVLLHFMLAYDHPFVDGNGRTARALFYWFMARQEYWLIEFISISGILKRAPAQYGYAFLHSETDDNDTTYFVIHQLKVILHAIDELHRYLARKVQDTKEALALLTLTKLAERLNHRQVALLEHALKNANAIYRIKEHQTLHGVVYQTARTDLMSLADTYKLLLKLKEGRTFVYMSPPDLKERIEKAGSEWLNAPLADDDKD